MFIKIICLLALLVKINCAQEVHSSRLLKVLTGDDSNQEHKNGSTGSNLENPEGIGAYQRHLTHLDDGNRIDIFKATQQTVKKKKNIVKRSVVVVGVNCPEGQVLPKGEKCSCKENSKCILTVKIGDRTVTREVIL